MKTKFIAAAVVMFVVAGVTFQSCKKKEKENTYVLQYDLPFKAPAHAANSEFNLVDTALSSKLSSAMSDFGLSLDNVKSVKLNTLSVSLDPSEISNGKTFDPYQYANAHIGTTATNEEQVAFTSNITPGATTVKFDSQHAEWVDYLKQSQFNVRVKAYNETDVPATNYTMTLSFDVV